MRNNHSGNGLWKGFMLLCIGCVLIAIGLSFGGRWTNFRWWPWQNGHHNFDFNWDFGSGHGRSHDDNVIRDIVELDEPIPSGIRNIDINLKAASLVIGTGVKAEGSCHATDFEEGDITIWIDGDTLRILENDWRHISWRSDDFPRPKVEIVLPAGAELGDVNISVGAGTVTINPLSSDEFTVESGAGTFKGTGIASRFADLQTGAGSIELDDCAFEETNITTGAGRIAFKGSLGARSEVSTGVGSVVMTIAGDEDDYRIDFDRGIGSIRIGGESYNGAGNGSAGNRKANQRIKISSGVGSVRIDFDSPGA